MPILLAAAAVESDKERVDYGREYADDLTDLVAKNRDWPSERTKPIYRAIHAMDTDSPADWRALADVTSATELAKAEKLALVWDSVAGEVERGGSMGAADFLSGYIGGVADDAMGVAGVASDVAHGVKDLGKSIANRPILWGVGGLALLAFLATRK